jgi:hypothetical protein
MRKRRSTPLPVAIRTPKALATKVDGSKSVEIAVSADKLRLVAAAMRVSIFS